eukprot:gene16961-23237_t
MWFSLQRPSDDRATHTTRKTQQMTLAEQVLQRFHHHHLLILPSISLAHSVPSHTETYSTQYAGVNVAQRPSTYSPHYSGASRNPYPLQLTHKQSDQGLQVTPHARISSQQQRGAAPTRFAMPALAIGGLSHCSRQFHNAASCNVRLDAEGKLEASAPRLLSLHWDKGASAPGSRTSSDLAVLVVEELVKHVCVVLCNKAQRLRAVRMQRALITSSFLTPEGSLCKHLHV